MYLTGQNAKRPGSYALENAATLLENALHAAPYDAIFEPWGRVEVFRDWASAKSALNSRRPMLVLELGPVGEDPESNIIGGARLLIEISIEVIVGPFCAPAESLLKDALKAIFSDSIDALDALALEESELRAGQGSARDEGRINPHTLFLSVHTLNS